MPTSQARVDVRTLDETTRLAYDVSLDDGSQPDVLVSGAIHVTCSQSLRPA